MPALAIILLLLGATLHTTWNLVIKQARDKYIVTWWVVVIGGAASLIALFFTGLPPRSLWGLAFLSVGVEAVYFLTLSYAYGDHDFSLVYPIAGGAAPAFLALWAFLFLGGFHVPRPAWSDDDRRRASRDRSQRARGARPGAAARQGGVGRIGAGPADLDLHRH